MKVGEVKKALECYSDDAEFEIYNVNTDCTYSNEHGCYDIWIEGNLDIPPDRYFERERSPESTKVTLKIFR